MRSGRRRPCGWSLAQYRDVEAFAQFGSDLDKRDAGTDAPTASGSMDDAEASRSTRPLPRRGSRYAIQIYAATPPEDRASWVRKLALSRGDPATTRTNWWRSCAPSISAHPRRDRRETGLLIRRTRDQAPTRRYDQCASERCAPRPSSPRFTALATIGPSGVTKGRRCRISRSTSDGANPRPSRKTQQGGEAR